MEAGQGALAGIKPYDQYDSAMEPTLDIAGEPVERKEGGLPPLPERDSGGALGDVSNREELYRVLDADSNRGNLQRVQ